MGAPRGAERWRIKDGVARDGRILSPAFTGFFDGGAYTRLSSYAIIKCTGHLPGPYTIPNVASNVFCVYTNRTPATAMRGFGITGVDFAIECHMDKVAETVGMNPVELSILQRLSRRRHEGASQACQEHRTDRMLPGREPEGQGGRSTQKPRGNRACQTVAVLVRKFPKRLPTASAGSASAGSADIPTDPELWRSVEGPASQRARRVFRSLRLLPQDEDMLSDRPDAHGIPAGRHNRSSEFSAESIGPACTTARSARRPYHRNPQRQPPPVAQVQPQPTAREHRLQRPTSRRNPFPSGVKRPGVSRFLSGSRRR